MVSLCKADVSARLLNSYFPQTLVFYDHAITFDVEISLSIHMLFRYNKWLIIINQVERIWT